MLRIHDIMTAFTGLDVPGLSFYPDRALILSGITVVKDGPIDEYLAYLRDVGVGASDVVRVPSEGLVHASIVDDGLREIVSGHLKDGLRLQFFSTTAVEQRLLDVLGVDWGATFSAPPTIGAMASCKASLRRMGARIGLLDAFPEHAICRTRPEIYVALGRLFMTDADFIVIKRPDLASGDGMVRVTREVNWVDTVEPFLERHFGNELIIEAGYAHEAMSVQWEVGDEGPEFVCGTGQLIDGFVHKGNVISSSPIPSVSASDIARMREMTEPFVREYAGQGFRGVCGFDLLKTADNRIFLLECNGRVTATTYCYGLARQIRDRVPSWTILMTNLTPSSEYRSFASLRRALGRDLFDGRFGILPFNLRCLELEAPKFTVCSVGRDLDEARTLLERNTKRLS